MNEEQLLHMINHYLAGKATRKEISQLEAWLQLFNQDPSPITSLTPKELQDIAHNMFAAISRTLDAHPDDISLSS